MISLDAIVTTYDLVGAIDLMGVISQWMIFILKIILMIYVGYAISITIPGFLMVIAFILIDYMLLDKLTNFLISGSWNTINQVKLTPDSPLMIMLYIGIVFGMIFFVIFLVNYMVRNAANVSPAKYVKKISLMLAVPLFILFLPFVYVIISMFVKIMTASLVHVFSQTQLLKPIYSSNSLVDSIKFLLNVPNVGQINPDDWQNAWQNVQMTATLSQLQNSLFLQYNQIANFMGTIHYTDLIIQLNNQGDNLTGLQKVFEDKANFGDLRDLSMKLMNLSMLLDSLSQQGLSADQLNDINNLLKGFNSPETVKQIIEANNYLIAQGQFLVSNTINDQGELAHTTNFAYNIFYLVSGIQVNNIDGVLATAAYGWLTLIFNPSQLILIIVIGTAVVMGIARGVFKYVATFAYRWYWIFRSIPAGAVAMARTANENDLDSSLIRLWFRETLTVFISLFVSALSFMTFVYVSSIVFGAVQQQNVLSEVSTWVQRMAVKVILLIFIIVLMYSSLTANDKILDSFNQARTFNDVASNQVMREYAAAKQNRNNSQRGISTWAHQKTQHLSKVNEKGLSHKFMTVKNTWNRARAPKIKK